MKQLKIRPTFGSALLLAGVLVSTATLAAQGFVHLAHACSTLAPPVELKGAPAAGQTEVPTDVVPIIQGWRAQLAQDAALDGVFTLQSQDGQSVELTPTWGFDAWLELVPTNSLLPNTQYTLSANLVDGTNPVTKELTFTTGAGPTLTAPESPTASLQHWHFDSDVMLSSCSPWENGTCFALPPAQLVSVSTLTASGDYSPYQRLVDGAFIGDLTGSNTNAAVATFTYDCAELRTRALNGELSAPLKLCRNDGPSLNIVGSDAIECSSQGLMHDGVPAKDGHTEGCSLSFAGRVNSGAAWLGSWLPMLVALRLRRRFSGPMPARTLARASNPAARRR